MNQDNMQHGHDYSGQTVSGWLASEKYDGCRAYWDGSRLWSRGGIDIRIPDEWRNALPAGIALDGEVYHGVDGQRRCASAVRWAKFQPDMVFKVFDAPAASGDWLSRLAGIVETDIVKPVTAQVVAGIDEALELMRAVQSNGGEGVMLRHPALPYAPGRTDKMLKLKTADFPH
jgi:DNA ligase-1